MQITIFFDNLDNKYYCSFPTLYFLIDKALLITIRSLAADILYQNRLFHTIELAEPLNRKKNENKWY